MCPSHIGEFVCGNRDGPHFEIFVKSRKLAFQSNSNRIARGSWELLEDSVLECRSRHSFHRDVASNFNRNGANLKLFLHLVIHLTSKFGRKNFFGYGNECQKQRSPGNHISERTWAALIRKTRASLSSMRRVSHFQKRNFPESIACIQVHDELPIRRSVLWCFYCASKVWIDFKRKFSAGWRRSPFSRRSLRSFSEDRIRLEIFVNNLPEDSPQSDSLSNSLLALQAVYFS